MVKSVSALCLLTPRTTLLIIVLISIFKFDNIFIAMTWLPQF